MPINAPTAEVLKKLNIKGRTSILEESQMTIIQVIIIFRLDLF